MFPFFASFIIFSIILRHQIKKSKNLEIKNEKEFWARENQANSTRKKPLDSLDYIQIPLDHLPFDILADNPQVIEYTNTIQNLAEKTIVNFTGISNTDLKLSYGVANLPILTEYDQNYTLLVRTLQEWASLLAHNGYPMEAIQILEFSVSTKTDVSTTYSLLIDLYFQTGQEEKIHSLLPIAQQLNSVMKNKICRTVEQADPYTDLLRF